MTRRAYLGGRVLTMDATDRVAEGFITSGGRVEAVGHDAELRGLLDGADVVDLGGRWWYRGSWTPTAISSSPRFI